MMRRFVTRLGSREVGLLGLILAGALGIRLLGVGRGLPYLHEWDEPTVLSNVVGMLQRGDLTPHEFIYPHVYFYLLLPVVYLHYVYLHAHGVLSSPWDIQLSQPLEPYWYMHPASFYLWGRTLTSLIGTATVFLVYRIGKTVYGPAVALLAAALLALAPGAVYYSDTVRVDLPLAFFVTLTILGGLSIIRHGRWQNYLLAGLLAGLAISTKISVANVVVTLLVAHFVTPTRRRLVDLRLAVMGVCVLVGIVAGTPSLLMAPRSFLEQYVRSQVPVHDVVPSISAMWRTLPGFLSYFVRPSQGQEWFVVPHAAIGLLPAIAAVIGIAAGFRWDRRLHLYLLSFPLPYFLFVSGQKELIDRYMMPVLPFAALFAAVGSIWAWQWLQVRWPTVPASRMRALAALALIALLAAPGWEAVALGWTLGHQPDTRTAAVEWLQRHAAPGATIAFEEDLRWHLPDLYRLPFGLRFAPRDATVDWYLRQRVDFAVVGDRSPLRSLAAVAAFPRPAYMGAEAKYPVIDPPLYIVRPKTPEINATFPVEVTAGEMLFNRAATTASGMSSETVHLPDQPFTPGAYTLSINGGWPQPGAPPDDRLTANVVVGQQTVGTVAVNGGRPLRFTTPVFQIDHTQTLPVEVELTFRIRQRPPEQTWALRPPANGCAVAPDAPNLDMRQLTVEAWVYLEGMNEPPEMRARGLESEGPIVGKGKHEGYYLRLVGDASGRVYADLSVAGKFSAGRAAFVPLRTWTHIAATYNGREARIYLNGTPAPPERDPHHEGAVHAEGAPLVIGCRDPGTPRQTVFNGLITGVRIWDRVLPLDDIRDEAGLRTLSDTTPGLVGSWSFQSPVRGVVPDLSGAGNNLIADSPQRVPIKSGPLTPVWTPGQNILRTVKINQVAFPVTVNTGDMTLTPIVSTAAGVSSETVQLPDQPFIPGSYTLTVTGAWPPPAASSADRLTAAVVVGRKTVGTVTVTGTQPLRFTTPLFQIDRTQTLPVRVDLTFRMEQRALRPPANGCAIAPDAPNLDAQQLTVEAWVYLEGMNGPPGMRARGLESEAPILGKGHQSGYYLRLVGDASSRIFADLSIAGKFSVGRAGFVPSRRWTHIAATYDGHKVWIYLNGIPAILDERRDPHHQGTVHAEGAPLVIGCRDPGTPYQIMFKGLIAGARIWNRALSPDTIRDEAGLRPLPDTSTGLVGAWSFQSLVRGVVPDLSGAGNTLRVDSLQRVPTDIGPPVRSEWISGQNPLRSVRLARVTFPVAVHAGDMTPTTIVSTATGISSETVQLPDQPFIPGSYTLTVTGAWPPPAAAPADRLTAAVVVGRKTVGTVTVTGTQPLRFTTPPFRIDQTVILPVRVDLTSWTEQQALRPPANGCAIAPDAPNLDMRQLTVEAWVYLEGMNEPPEMRARGLESEGPIVGKGKHEGYYLRLVGDASNRIFADLSVAGKFSVGRAGFVPFRKWTHIAATYNGHEARIYLNGTPAPPDRDPHHEGAVHAGGAPLVIGCRDPGTFDQLVFIGFINRVRIWNKALPPDAIRDEAGLRPLPDMSTGLVGAWSFQSLVRGVVPDLSAAGNTLRADSLQPLPPDLRLPAPPKWTQGPPDLPRTVTIEQAAR